jgi:nitrogen fixation/metabolism regulation signal transduction histidine kinase
MFNNVTNLAQTRSHIEAVGFFLVYTVLLVGLSTFLGHYLVTLGVIDGTVGSFFDGGSVHTMIGAGWTLVLSSMVLTSKKLTSDIMSVVIALIGVYLAYTVNVMLGMVVVSYLTTLGK